MASIKSGARRSAGFRFGLGTDWVMSRPKGYVRVQSAAHSITVITGTIRHSHLVPGDDISLLITQSPRQRLRALSAWQLYANITIVAVCDFMGNLRRLQYPLQKKNPGCDDGRGFSKFNKPTEA